MVTRLDLHPPAAPADRRDHGAEPDAVEERGGERLDDRVVAFDHAGHAPLPHLAPRASPSRERALADQLRVGRMEPLDELHRELAVGRGHRLHAIERVAEGTVRRAVLAESPHHAVEPLPEVVHERQPALGARPAAARDVHEPEVVVERDAVELRSIAVHELGAQLDGYRQRRGPHRPYAPADAVARLEDDDIFTPLVQPLRRGQAGGAGADDDGRHRESG